MVATALVVATALGVGTALVVAGASPARHEIDPAGRVAATIPMGDPPSSLTAGEFKVWVTTRSGALTGISPASERDDPPVSVGEGAEPVAVAIGFGSVWVVDRANDALVRMNPGQDIPPERIQVGPSPSDVAAGDRWLWVANAGDGTVARVDPNTNVANLTVNVGGSPRSLAYGAGLHLGRERTGPLRLARRRIRGNGPRPADRDRSSPERRRHWRWLGVGP